jgi:hypothetical protein
MGILIALVAGVVIGWGVPVLVRRAGGLDVPGIDEVIPEPVAGLVFTVEQTAGNLRVAVDVLDVADHLDSNELRRRLAAAVATLPGVVLIDPVVGTPFDPRRHVWDRTVPAVPGIAVPAVAGTMVAGVASADGTVVRPAHVSVHDDPNPAVDGMSRPDPKRLDERPRPIPRRAAK